MRRAVIISAALHVIVIVLTIVGLPRWFSGSELVFQQVIPVEVLPASEETNIAETVKSDEPKPEAPEPKPEEQEQVASVPPEQLDDLQAPEIAPPLIDKIPEPPPEPEPEAKKEPPKEIKPPKPKPDEKPKKEAKKDKDRDVDQIMKDLLAQGPQQKDESQPTPSDKTRQRVGLGTGLTMSELDALRGQVGRCWSPNLGAPGAAEMVVVLEFSLTPDGNVRGTPEVVQDTSRMSEPYYRAAAEAAQRAIVQCAPYQLPAEKYDIWKDVELTMDPSKIAGL